jgi:orotate phosphoribosyltransferase
MFNYQAEFISYALSCEVLKFGEFRLKSGRVSPYFFNTGLFDTGAKLGRLGQFYAQALIESGLKPDMLYGPAYKGIPLVAATAISYAQITGQDIPFVFNRKETKDHGEGGDTVGATLEGRVLIVDDVITAGTSVKESVEVIKRAGAIPAGVLIALDRQETVESGHSAIQEVSECYKIPVVPIITLADIVTYIESHDRGWVTAIANYRQKYGVS